LDQDGKREVSNNSTVGKTRPELCKEHPATLPIIQQLSGTTISAIPFRNLLSSSG
jgi:hypothetical protein